jgi:hypothetical protein
VRIKKTEKKNLLGFWKGHEIEKTLFNQYDKGFLQPPFVFRFRSPKTGVIAYAQQQGTTFISPLLKVFQ